MTRVGGLDEDSSAGMEMTDRVWWVLKCCVCDMRSAVPTVWNLHLSVANQLTGQEGLCVSVLNESVLHHLHHAQSRLQGKKQTIKNMKNIYSKGKFELYMWHLALIIKFTCNPSLDLAPVTASYFF